MKDVLGEALSDYHHHNSSSERLWIRNRYGPREEIAGKRLFQGGGGNARVEWVRLCKNAGERYWISGGAGSHALVLQQMGHEITALDSSPKAAEIMKLRGVKKIIRPGFF